MSLPLRFCSSCGAPIAWAVMDSGARLPVDHEPGELAQGMVAVNPATGRGRVVAHATVDGGEAERWRAAGATFHEPHHATCPTVAQHRVHREQQSLELDVEPWACEGCGSTSDRYDGGTACERCVHDSFAESG